MAPDDVNARQKIYQATLDLINEGEDVEKLTTRRIAARAGVNPALVNYHYQTKENLLGQVVVMLMGGIIDRVLQAGGGETAAETKLRNILISTADAAFQYYNVCRIALSTEIKQGCRNSCEMVLPLLKEMSPGVEESDLNVIALQLMLPFHHIVLNPNLYGRYLNTDFFDEQQRKRTINRMVDRVLAGLCKEEGK